MLRTRGEAVKKAVKTNTGWLESLAQKMDTPAFASTGTRSVLHLSSSKKSSCEVKESLENLLPHIARDWLEEYPFTAGIVHDPVLRMVQSFVKPGGKVLVPGGGVGRLAWELQKGGYEVDVNE